MKINGILKGYPQIKKRFGKLSAYIQLIRPFTILAPLLAGLLGVLATIEFSVDNLLIAIYAGVTLGLAQATGQIINQYADADLDKMIKSYRPIPSGIIRKEEALGMAWLFALFSIARGFTVNPIFGLATLTLIFFAVFYSLSPFSPRKIHPILNITWMAIARGFIPIIAVWSISGVWEKALPYALLGFFWVLGFQSTKDLDDIDGDRAFGIKTIANTYGFTKLLALMLGCSFTYLIIAMLSNLHFMVLLLPVAWFSILNINKKSRFTENNLGWLGFYIGLSMLYLLMLINEKVFFI